MTLSKKDCLNKNISVRLLELAPKIQASQVHQRHYVALFCLKNRRAQYENSQKSRKNGKNKKDGENEKSERGRKSLCGNKVDPMVEKNSDLQASDYYYIIYRW